MSDSQRVVVSTSAPIALWREARRVDDGPPRREVGAGGLLGRATARVGQGRVIHALRTERYIGSQSSEADHRARDDDRLVLPVAKHYLEHVVRRELGGWGRGG